MNSQRRSFHHRCRPNVAKVEMGVSTTNLFCFAGMNESVDSDEGISPRLSPHMAIKDQQPSSSRRVLGQPRMKSPPSKMQRAKSEHTSFRKDIEVPPRYVSGSTSIKKTNLKPPPPEGIKLITPPSEQTNEPVFETCNNHWTERTSRISIVTTASCDDTSPPPPQAYDRNADWQLRMIQEWESRQLRISTSTAAATAISNLSNQEPIQMDQFEKLKSSSRPEIVRPRPTSHVSTERRRIRNFYSDDSGYWDAPDINALEAVPVEHIPGRANERGFDIGHHELKNTEESPIEMIEVKPGHEVPLKGSEETWKAVCRGKAIDTECSSCQTFLYCVATAKIVLCPCCQFLSTVDGGHDEVVVGIGLTVEYVAERMSG